MGPRRFKARMVAGRRAGLPLRPHLRSRPVAHGGVPHEPLGPQLVLRRRPMALLSAARRMALRVVGNDARRSPPTRTTPPRSRAGCDRGDRGRVGSRRSFLGRLDGAPPTMTSSTVRLVVVALAALFCTAHLGSPDVWFAGWAGPYAVRALIRMPRTIPGVAELVVEIPDDGVRGVRVQTLEAGTGERFQPEPEPIRPLGGGRFTGRLWFMTEGAHGVRIEVMGARGRAEVVVPAIVIE